MAGARLVVAELAGPRLFETLRGALSRFQLRHCSFPLHSKDDLETEPVNAPPAAALRPPPIWGRNLRKYFSPASSAFRPHPRTEPAPPSPDPSAGTPDPDGPSRGRAMPE